jgi:hypothetical protein
LRGERLSRRIAGKASSLTIVDLQPEMMSRALEAVRRAHPGASVAGVVQDMRHLTVDGMFDLVIISREALQLFPPEEGAAILSKAASRVAAGGRLLLDMAVFGSDALECPDPDYHFPGHFDGVWYVNWSKAVSSGTILTRSSAQWHDADSIRFDLKYDLRCDVNVVESWASQMRLYRYERSWLDRAMPAGMSLQHVHGCYKKSVFSDASHRLTAIYRRPH